MRKSKGKAPAPVPSSDIYTKPALNEVEAAQFLDISLRCLRDWRWKRIGPPFSRFQKCVLYRRDALLAWLASHEVRTRQLRHTVSA